MIKNRSMVKTKSLSEAFRMMVAEVDNILSKLHEFDYRGNPIDASDPTWIDAKLRLTNLEVIINEDRISPISEGFAEQLIMDELHCRQEQRDKQEAIARPN